MTVAFCPKFQPPALKTDDVISCHLISPAEASRTPPRMKHAVEEYSFKNAAFFGSKMNVRSSLVRLANEEYVRGKFPAQRPQQAGGATPRKPPPAPTPGRLQTLPSGEEDTGAAPPRWRLQDDDVGSSPAQPPEQPQLARPIAEQAAADAQPPAASTREAPCSELPQLSAVRTEVSELQRFAFQKQPAKEAVDMPAAAGALASPAVEMPGPTASPEPLRRPPVATTSSSAAPPADKGQRLTTAAPQLPQQPAVSRFSVARTAKAPAVAASGSQSLDRNETAAAAPLAGAGEADCVASARNSDAARKPVIAASNTRQCAPAAVRALRSASLPAAAESLPVWQKQPMPAGRKHAPNTAAQASAAETMAMAALPLAAQAAAAAPAMSQPALDDLGPGSEAHTPALLEVTNVVPPAAVDAALAKAIASPTASSSGSDRWPSPSRRPGTDVQRPQQLQQLRQEPRPPKGTAADCATPAAWTPRSKPPVAVAHSQQQRRRSTSSASAVMRSSRSSASKTAASTTPAAAADDTPGGRVSEATPSVTAEPAAAAAVEGQGGPPKPAPGDRFTPSSPSVRVQAATSEDRHSSAAEVAPAVAATPKVGQAASHKPPAARRPSLTSPRPGAQPRETTRATASPAAPQQRQQQQPAQPQQAQPAAEPEAAAPPPSPTKLYRQQQHGSPRKVPKPVAVRQPQPSSYAALARSADTQTPTLSAPPQDQQSRAEPNQPSVQQPPGRQVPQLAPSPHRRSSAAAAESRASAESRMSDSSCSSSASGSSGSEATTAAPKTSEPPMTLVRSRWARMPASMVPGSPGPLANSKTPPAVLPGGYAARAAARQQQAAAIDAAAATHCKAAAANRAADAGENLPTRADDVAEARAFSPLEAGRRALSSAAHGKSSSRAPARNTQAAAAAALRGQHGSGRADLALGGADAKRPTAVAAAVGTPFIGERRCSRLVCQLLGLCSDCAAEQPGAGYDQMLLVAPTGVVQTVHKPPETCSPPDSPSHSGGVSSSAAASGADQVVTQQSDQALPGESAAGAAEPPAAGAVGGPSSNGCVIEGLLPVIAGGAPAANGAGPLLVQIRSAGAGNMLSPARKILACICCLVLVAGTWSEAVTGQDRTPVAGLMHVFWCRW